MAQGTTRNVPIDTDITLAANSDLLVPSQKAVKTYAAGLAVPINNFTGRITMGTATGTSLLCFPDAGTTAANGIQFGLGASNLYRSAADTIKSDGTLNAASFNTSTGVFTQNILRVSNSGGLFLGYQGGGGGLKLLPNSGTTVYAEVRSTGEFALTPPALTGSLATSALSITQTLNTSGSPDIISLDFTNTSSGAATNLLNFKLVGGASLFKVTKLGEGVMLSAKIGTISFVSNNVIAAATAADLRIVIPTTTKALVLSSDYSSSTGTSALLEVKSTVQGFLPPRMTTTQKNAIGTPTTGLVVFDTTLNKLCVYVSPSWQTITSI